MEREGNTSTSKRGKRGGHRRAASPLVTLRIGHAVVRCEVAQIADVRAQLEDTHGVQSHSLPMGALAKQVQNSLEICAGKSCKGLAKALQAAKGSFLDEDKYILGHIRSLAEAAAFERHFSTLGAQAWRDQTFGAIARARDHASLHPSPGLPQDEPSTFLDSTIDVVLSGEESSIDATCDCSVRNYCASETTFKRNGKVMLVGTGEGSDTYIAEDADESPPPFGSCGDLATPSQVDDGASSPLCVARSLDTEGDPIAKTEDLEPLEQSGILVQKLLKMMSISEAQARHKKSCVAFANHLLKNRHLLA